MVIFVAKCIQNTYLFFYLHILITETAYFAAYHILNINRDFYQDVYTILFRI